MPPTADSARSPYLRLYQTAKRLAWDPAQLDLTHDAAEWPRLVEQEGASQHATQILHLCALFHAGEQSVTQTLSPFLSAVARAGLGIDKELFLTAQLFEEAKHYEFFERYAHEVLGADAERLRAFVSPAPQAVLVDDLEDVAHRLRREDDPAVLRTLLVEGITHYMGVVEAMLARTGYVAAHEALAERGWLPGLQEAFRLIRRDEGRHVAFGINVVREQVAAHPEDRALVTATFERHLPHVLATVQSFADYADPIVDLGQLQQFAVDAYRHFMIASGVVEGEAPMALLAELEQG
jgi:ribonucleoside-diphosphate reductase beta chain